MAERKKKTTEKAPVDAAEVEEVVAEAVAERGQRLLVERPRDGEVADAKGHVVEHGVVLRRWESCCCTARSRAGTALQWAR